MIVSVADLKTYLKMTGSGLDTFLTTVSSEAQDMLEAWMNRKFEQATYTEDFSGDNTNVRVVNNKPIISVTQVLVSIDDTSEISATGYKVFKEQGIVTLKANVFPVGTKNCRIIYNGGYASGQVPVAVQLAIKQISALIYKESGQGEGRLGKSSVNQPDGATINYVDKLPVSTMKMLSRYRDVRFA